MHHGRFSTSSLNELDEIDNYRLGKIAMTSDVIMFLGLSIILGGQIVFWNVGLDLSHSDALSNGLPCLCLSEMTCILSFAGLAMKRDRELMMGR